MCVKKLDEDDHAWGCGSERVENGEAQESKKQDQQEAIDVAMVSLTHGVSWLQ